MERILNKRTFGNSHAERWIRHLVPRAVVVFFMVFNFAVSSEDTVFGPMTYRRTSDLFNVFQESFSIADVFSIGSNGALTPVYGSPFSNQGIGRHPLHSNVSTILHQNTQGPHEQTTLV